MNYTIYCDMDGVLVNFEKRADEICTGCIDKDPGKFWKLVTKMGPKFWSEMEWMPDGKELWEYIKHYNPIILSATITSQRKGEGKREWLRKNISDKVAKEAQIVLKSQKKEYAIPTSILIDDREDNIREFVKYGGKGILHVNTKETIKQLKLILEVPQ